MDTVGQELENAKKSLHEELSKRHYPSWYVDIEVDQESGLLRVWHKAGATPPDVQKIAKEGWKGCRVEIQHLGTPGPKDLKPPQEP